MLSARSILSSVCILLGFCLALYGYRDNMVWLFWLAAAFTTGALVFLGYATKWRRFWIFPMLANTATLLVLCFGVAESVIYLRMPNPKTAPRATAFSFKEAKADPWAYWNAWEYYRCQWGKLSTHILGPDPEGTLPFILVPNSEVTFGETLLTINSKGFRNREFEEDKKDRYRIVAIGESTTMGATIGKGDRPWPQVLEWLIKTEMKCPRPVEVINAGVQCYNLADNLIRLKRDILPLQPDMIISYHGYNGFTFISDFVSSLRGSSFAAFLPYRRASYLLARLEYEIKNWAFRRRYNTYARTDQVQLLNGALLDTKYAALYRELISLCRSKGIELVLCSHNMAVNQKSPAEAIEFYRLGFPEVGYSMEVNRLHTRLLEMLHDDGAFIYVNTSKELDGSFQDNYLDLIHFTQKGRDRLARNIFEGIKPLLEGGAVGCQSRERKK